MSESPLLTIRRLSVHYPLPRWVPWRRKLFARAVDGINFNLEAGETLGVVGESGCGKSSLARALVGLQPISGGAVHFQGRDLARLGKKDWRLLRRDIQLVFQDPLASLNPRQTVARIIEQPLIALMPELDAAQRTKNVAAILERVGLEPALLKSKPRDLSGGQAQRVGIARALVVEPKLLICDEPVSALDVSIQAQIVNLLADLQRERNLAILFIAHDLAIVRQLCQRVLVMYAGRVMEQGAREPLFARPVHPYTQALIRAVPGKGLASAAEGSEGEPPDPAVPLLGCAFRSRCPIADDYCGRVTPSLRRTGEGLDHYAACHFSAPDLAELADSPPNAEVALAQGRRLVTPTA